MKSAPVFAVALAFAAIAVEPARADRLALWTIVHDQCEVHAKAGQGPAPCERIDLAHGDDLGAALLKDRVGIAQFLVIPTRRVTGVEDPFVLAPSAPDYFAFAWAARDAVAARLGRPLRREDVSIAINSAFARSQDQLHLHLDCLDKDVAATLQRDLGSFDETWRPMAEPLKGRVYWARRVVSGDLTGVRPLALLADGVPDAKTHIADESLIAVGATFAGADGFVLLADRAELTQGGHAEDLQDHDCAVAKNAR